eukprot:g220.t1
MFDEQDRREYNGASEQGGERHRGRPSDERGSGSTGNPRMNAGGGGFGGPSPMHPNLFLAMESIVEKLKILGYDQVHRHGNGNSSSSHLFDDEANGENEDTRNLPKSISRSHFVLKPQESIGRNNKVLFDEFIALCQWLFNLIFRERGSIDKQLRIDPFDTPNNRMSTVLMELKGLGFDAPFSAYKVTKQVHGMESVSVLSFLCDAALSAKHFSFAPPEIKNESTVDEAEVDASADIADVLDDDFVRDDILMNDGNMSDDDSRDGGSPHNRSKHFLPNDLKGKDLDSSNLDGTGGLGISGKLDSKYADDESKFGGSLIQGAIRSSIDPLLWSKEVAKVTPQLKLDTKSLGQGGSSKGQWRGHLDQTRLHDKKIRKILSSTQEKMGTVSKVLRENLELIKNKESIMNRLMGPLQETYNEKITALKNLRVSCETYSSDLSSKQNELSAVSDRLDELKVQMNERGSNMTDTGPLVSIKAALKQIKGEIKEMELRMGVVSHALMAAKLNEKSVSGKTSSA